MLLPTLLLASLPVGPSAESTLQDSAQVVDLIAFGSCARNDRPQTIWPVIGGHEPDLFLFIGDNTYADLKRVPETAAEIQRAYDELEAVEGWRALRDQVPVLATWDDHDYGKNDAGVEWELKAEAQRLFLDFYGVAADSPRRDREGIYHAEVFGPPGRRVQVILLDTRYHRDPLTRKAERVRGRGPYTAGTGGTILGEEQWAWLEAQLSVPAELRILASSIQVVASEHGWEAWANFPHERARLYRLLDDTNANGVIAISGDRHLIELSCDRSRGAPYPFWDFTSSGLNEPEKPVAEPNAHRVGPVLRKASFGLIRVDWEAGVVTLEGRGVDDAVLLSQLVWLDRLRE